MMKILGFLLLVIWWGNNVCTGQQKTREVLQVNEIPREGILLDKGWKFHPGDDSSWAKSDFDDSQWEAIDPSVDINQVAQFQKTNIGWFRLTLELDSQLNERVLGILLSQIGASEIFLNGKLIFKFGKVSNEKPKEQTHYLVDQPFSIKFNDKGKQTIAIRYSYTNRGPMARWGVHQNYCLRIILNTADAAYSMHQKDIRISAIYEITQGALWLILCTICLILYFYLRAQKAYLIICLFSFLHAFTPIVGVLFYKTVNSNILNFYLIFLSRLLPMIGATLTVIAFCRLFNQKINWFFYFLMAGALFAMSSFFWSYELALNIYLAVILLFAIEYTRRAFIAITQNYKGAGILFSGQLIFFLCAVLATFLINYDLTSAATLAGFVGIVCIPVAWCIFIAEEFGRTALALQARVSEIEQLSKRAIIHEQEKQQILSSQKETLEMQVIERTAELKQSVEDLKSSQAQLIQSEKMASLGELTAGIAHEIQNPLNFVNNFSDVNTELLEELKVEADKGNIEEVKAIANDVIANEQKINHHGKRADAIVKGMLQHSRSGSNIKEPTDINALADEYLRLAYHGVRAKHKDFNTTLKTDFDVSIGGVSIIPQDIGRVLLNLYNNAFYAVKEKSFEAAKAEYFEPQVSVSTKRNGDNIIISVKDNGNGIPQKIADKIFQPFFTTKPTGQGTGLGLSLAYDIVKAHGGEIKVKSNEGECTEFIIILPVD